MSGAAILYRAAAALLTPALPFYLRARARKGKEDPRRLPERFGHAAMPRPAGQLVWIHGASVGETLATLPLIEALLKPPARHVLVTSGTVGSARLMAERLPARAFHQYAPLDTPKAAGRFLDHWRPDLGMFVDSELWPHLLRAAAARAIPLMLVNARMSERAFRGWRRWPRFAREVLGNFTACLAQDEPTAVRLGKLGAPGVRISGSLKADAPSLPADASAFAALQKDVGHRPVLFAASTHEGEEAAILDAGRELLPAHSNLLVIIAPRHPARGSAVAALARERNMTARQRSENILPGTARVYIADTLGELGLFYRLARFAFMGGSLVPHGGQNPLEPGQLGCAVMTGQYTDNFTEAFSAILSAQGMGGVRNAGEIGALAGQWLAHPEEAHAAGERAACVIASLSGATHLTAEKAETLLARHARP